MTELKAIDKVYVVNLASRTDRREGWDKLMVHLPVLKEKLEFFTAVDGSKVDNQTKLGNGELGCSMSHIAIWKDALEKGYQNILVFEDDVIFKDDFEPRLNDLLKDVDQQFDWVYLYNSWDYRPVEDFSDNLYKVIASLGTVSYIMHANAIGRLLPFVQEFVYPVDVVMGHMSFLSRVYRPKNIFLIHDDDSVSNVAGKKNSLSFFERIKKKINRRG